MSEETTHYAGFWLRFLAALLDGLVLLAGRFIFFGLLFLMIYAVLNLFEAGEWHRLVVYYSCAVIFAIANLWLTWIYYAKMESSKFQATLGKMAAGILVCDKNMAPVTFDRATARYFAKMITNLTLGIGWLMAAFTKRKQALHDHIAGTILIVKKNRY